MGGGELTGKRASCAYLHRIKKLFWPVFAGQNTPGPRAHLGSTTKLLAGDGAVPPHPGPLPRGEGERQATLGDIKRGCLARDRSNILPLPEGEGRGEGEGSAPTE